MRAPFLAVASVCVLATAAVVIIRFKTPHQKPAIGKPSVVKIEKTNLMEPTEATLEPVEQVVVQKSKPVSFSKCDVAFIQPKHVEVAVLTGTTDTLVHFSQGTVIKVDPSDFVSEQTGQPVAGPVRLQVKEFYSMEDILLHDLSTATKDRLLETNGMINVQAFAANGEACKLRKDGTIEILFPKMNDKPGMQLFTGEKDDMGNIVWEPVIIRSDKNSSDIPGTKATPATIAKDSIMKENSKKIIDTTLNSFPRFPGGLKGIEKNINSVKNPFPLKEQNALVIADFNVDVSGRICYVGIVKSGNEQYAASLSDALYKMEGWQPGVVKGNVKRMTMRLAVSFSINNPRLMKFWSCVKSPEQNATRILEFPYQSSQNTYQNSSEALLTNLVFESTSLGWINCDRFYNTPAPKTDFYVAAPVEEIASFKLVFHRIKAVLNASIIDGKYAFANVPIGEPVTIVALKGDKDHLQMAIQTTKINKGVTRGFNYIAVTAEDVKSTMQQFNKLPGAIVKN